MRPAIAILLGACLLASSGFSSVPQTPNILFIMADDLGISDLGSYGSDYYHTPHLDSLAGEGIRFTQAYSASTVCSPTRASILTGRYPHRVHITDALPWDRLPPNPRLIPPNHLKELPSYHGTYAKALQEAGYRTALFGKWHLGNEYVFYQQQGHKTYGFDEVYGADYKFINEVDKAVDVLTEQSLDFIERNKNRPFILTLFHHTPHIPLAVPLKYKAIYDDVPKGEIHRNQKYAGMMSHLDAAVKALLDKLIELDLTDNTVVIFTSDNGGFLGETSNLPFRDGKGSNYEGGIRVPLIIRWPNVIQPGTVSSVPVHSADFFPTFLEIAGLPLQPEAHLDGESILPVLKDEEDRFPTRNLVWHLPHYRGEGSPSSVYRSGNWKLLHRIFSDEYELYDLEKDPAESNNVAADHSGIVRHLSTLLHEHLEEVNALRMKLNPEWDPSRAQGENRNFGIFYPKHGGTYILIKDQPYPSWFEHADRPRPPR